MRDRADQRITQVFCLGSDLGLARNHPELARYHGDDDEQHKINNLIGVVNTQIINRWIEKEGRSGNTRDRGNDRWNETPVQRGDQHGYEIKDRDVINLVKM